MLTTGRSPATLLQEEKPLSCVNQQRGGQFCFFGYRYRNVTVATEIDTLGGGDVPDAHDAPLKRERERERKKSYSHR